jgi:hypothetical protein
MGCTFLIRYGMLQIHVAILKEQSPVGVFHHQGDGQHIESTERHGIRNGFRLRKIPF